jgi:predicted dehydrogenase
LTRNRPVSLVLAGIGGMGASYLDELLSQPGPPRFRLVGAVDPAPQRSRHRAGLQAMRIPIYESLEAFYAEQTAELAVISSPIADHASQTCLALSRGSHVLCEKPAAAVIQDVRMMSAAEAEAGRYVAVGFQWSFSRAVQELKADIRSGLYGPPRRLRCVYLWPRDESYYGRNDWAGRLRDARGRWVLDGPANNAMAHDLHNMLYVLGEARESSARPVRAQAELYRAYAIEGCDTLAGRVITREGVEILVFFSHATGADIGPVLSYEFEGGTVLASGRNASLKGVFRDGRIKDYGSPDVAPFQKLWDSLDAVRSGRTPACGLEAASSQTLCVNGFHESSPDIRDFPRRMLDSEGPRGGRHIIARGLEETFVHCYQQGRLPSEAGVVWARRGAEVDLEDYREFPAPKPEAHGSRA